MGKIYIVGIGGAGTSALATVYAKRGYKVSGSDVGDGYYHEVLRQQGITVWDTYDSTHIAADSEKVIHTTAVTTENPEITAAHAMGIPVLTYPQAIGDLTRSMPTVAVCGTHGKTTTTALTTYGLIGAHIRPTAIVGSVISAWHGGACVKGSDRFVIEADEYQNKLSLYDPHDVILTSVDFDHPDFFADETAYKNVFIDFVKRIPVSGYLVACGDHDAVRAVAAYAQCTVIYYGQNAQNDCVITDRSIDHTGQIITMHYCEKEYRIKTQLCGVHNACNATAAWLMSYILTKDADGSAQGVSEFAGTARRFERRGMYHEAILIDDYAHHPAEIRATLQAAREQFPDRTIRVAFHPHTFTRTKALLKDLARELSMADHVAVMDIYGSARESAGKVSAYDLVEAVNAYDTGKAECVPTVSDLAAWMDRVLCDGDVLLTLGAGDIWKVYDLLEK